jgi:glycerophosphoryl diester phosphodiesterase
MASFALAFAAGADGIEFDVRLSRDGKPVIIHDETLLRTAKISGAVSDFTAAELGQINVGSWFNELYPDAARPEFDREQLPSLKQLFSNFVSADWLFYLEMKCDPDRSGALAEAVVKEVRKFGLNERVVVESFTLNSLTQLKSIAPELRVAALFEPKVQRPLSILKRSSLVDRACRVGAEEIALHRHLINKRTVAKAALRGLATVVWTVDDPKWIQRAQGLGIKALITNDPQKMLQARSAIR